MFGQEAVAERVDTMTAIMSQKLKCDEVVSMEFSYAPPVSMVIDPIAQAAANCLEQIEAIESEINSSCCEVKEESTDSEEDKPVDDTSENLSFTESLRAQGLIQK